MEDDVNNGRFLTSVTDGKVIAVGELADGFYSKRTEGDGFAVLPFGDFASRCVRLFSGSKKIALFSPVDGVVTGITHDSVTLRTGDGVNVAVVFGEGALLFTETGSVLSRGDKICSIPRGRNAVPVLFTDPDQITELHVLSGFRRTADAAAMYKPLLQPESNKK